jgi:hypothetical protein
MDKSVWVPKFGDSKRRTGALVHAIRGCSTLQAKVHWSFRMFGAVQSLLASVARTLGSAAQLEHLCHRLRVW